MEDNIDKETLDHRQEAQSEIPSNEALTSNNASTKNENPETKEMEVHHHPKVEKKNFKEYLLEGLMIFIAVSLGFIAENIREKIGNHEIEKRNIEIIVDNLKSDTAQLSLIIAKNIEKRKSLDSLTIQKQYNIADTVVLKDIINYFVRERRQLFISFEQRST